MRIETLIYINFVIAALSFTVVWFYDWPVEAAGITGVFWVVTSSITMLRILWKRK